VVTELFFERPAALRAEHPELYDELARFYGRSPAEHPTGRPSDEPADGPAGP